MASTTAMAMHMPRAAARGFSRRAERRRNLADRMPDMDGGGGLFGSCAKQALLTASTALAVGVTLSHAAHAQTVIPSGTTTYNLNPANNPFVVNRGTTISLFTGALIYGSNASTWTLTNNGVLQGLSSLTSTGVILQAAATVVNTGLISGLGGGGVGINGAGMVTNQSGGVIFGRSVGVSITGGGTLVNAGSIESSIIAAVNFAGGGIVTNQAGGNINGGGGVSIAGGGAVTNAGAISGNIGSAITISGGGSVINSGALTSNSAAAISFAGAGASSVTNSGTITGNQGALSFAGTGGSIVINTGTIAANGGDQPAIGFSGGGAATVINAGTITESQGLSAISFTGAGTNLVILQSGAVVNAAITGSTTSGATNTLVLQGTGSFTHMITNFTTLTTQSGAAWTVALVGANSIDTSVIAGVSSLQIGDGPTASLTGDVTLIGGGSLKGYGVVIGNVINSSGTVAPGGPPILIGSPPTTIGTLTVTGSYSQSPNGNLTIEVSPAVASQLAVGGTAALAGGLTVTADPGRYVKGTTYAILTAAGGVTGTFDRTALVTPAASFTVSYLPNQVDLTVQTVGGSGLTYGSIGSAALGAGQAVANTLAQQLFASHGVASGAAGLAQAPSANRVQLAALDPVAALAQGPAPQPFAASPWSAWLTGFGVFGSVSGNANASGLSYTTGGTAFGADYRLDPSWLIGGFAGYAGTGTGSSTLAGASNGSIDSYTVGVYASWTLDPIYVDVMLGYAYNNDQLTRSILAPGFATATARASTTGNQFLSSVEAGRAYALADRLVATPFVGVQATALDQANFTETGAGALDLAVGGQSVSSVRSSLGGRLSRDLDLGTGGLVNVSLKLGWAHEFSDTGSSGSASFAGAPGSSFVVQGAQRGRDSALVGIGVAAQLDPQSSLYLRYDGDIDGPDNAHAVTGGVRLTW
jgi:fibronectin-binding autotransporter adhesin